MQLIGVNDEVLLKREKVWNEYNKKRIFIWPRRVLKEQFSRLNFNSASHTTQILLARSRMVPKHPTTMLTKGAKH
jgi:hypothetical protein